MSFERLLNRFEAKGLKTDDTTTTFEMDDTVYTISNDYLKGLKQRINRISIVYYIFGLFFGSGTMAALVTTIVEAVKRNAALTIGFGITAAVCFILVIVVGLWYGRGFSSVQDQGTKTVRNYRLTDLDNVTTKNDS